MDDRRLQNFSKPRDAVGLSKREKQVLRLMSGDKWISEIASELGSGGKSVDAYQERLRRKLAA